MADYGRQSHDLTSPQIQDYERTGSMSIGNNGSHAPEDGGMSSTNGAGAGGGIEPSTTSPISSGPEMPQQVQDVLTSEVRIPEILRYRRIAWLIRIDRCFHYAEQTQAEYHSRQG